MTESRIFVTDLCESEMKDVILNHANLFEVDLTDVNLLGGRLWGAELYESTLVRTNFTNASLWLARITRCDLTEAIVENAVIAGLRIVELRGHPKLPSVLRMDEDGREVLYGQPANVIFVQPAILEVYLNLRLGDIELACIQLHFADLHKNHIGSGVHFSGQRHEGPSTVLCFQADTYEAIYRVLPDILAPFPRSRAIDWRQTLASIPKDDRSQGMMALLDEDEGAKEHSSSFAASLARLFMDFRNSVVSCIKHTGQAPHIHVNVVQDLKLTNELAKAIESEPVAGKSMVVDLGDKNSIRIMDSDALKRFERHG